MLRYAHCVCLQNDSGNFMTRVLIIIIPLFILLTGFENPCDKKNVKKDGNTIFMYYPNCKDSSCYFARTFEKGFLVNEVWVNNNRPAGIENNYSGDKNNLITSTSYWGIDRRQFSISYFAGTNRTERILQLLADSNYFDIQFYSNGNIKTYGLTNSSYCNFGIWTEIDSLGLTKNSGQYKIVRKEEKKPYDNGTIITSWCFEKDSVWTTTNGQNKIIEQKKYIDGKLKNYD